MKVSELKKAFQEDLETLSAEDLVRKWLGSDGFLKKGFQELKRLDGPSKKEAGEILNTIKEKLESIKEELENQKIISKLRLPFTDCSFNFSYPPVGELHPVTQLEWELADFYGRLGFEVIDGPELETSFNNFDALNIPAHHPARDMQDTFYIVNAGPADLLRTHTTSIQARILSSGKVPIKAICFGKVYRNETEDASHQAMFHQFELLWVDTKLGLGHLLTLIEETVKFLFGDATQLRFVPKYYPYTEPSLGVQVRCFECRGSDCSFCGGSGFLTIAGAGVVHRNVLLQFGYDISSTVGLAFGFGTSRLAANKVGIKKLRSLYEGEAFDFIT